MKAAASSACDCNEKHRKKKTNFLGLPDEALDGRVAPELDASARAFAGGFAAPRDEGVDGAAEVFFVEALEEGEKVVGFALRDEGRDDGAGGPDAKTVLVDEAAD